MKIKINFLNKLKLIHWNFNTVKVENLKKKMNKWLNKCSMKN